MADTTRNEIMDQRSRTEYECNVLFKLIPLRDVLRLTRQQIAQRQQENNRMNMSPDDIKKKEKEIVREVYKMLRDLINKTKMFTVLMNGKKWMEKAVARADRRLERAEKREKRQRQRRAKQQVTASGQMFSHFTLTSANELEDLLKLPEGEEKEKAFKEHIRKLEQRIEERRRFLEIEALEHEKLLKCRYNNEQSQRGKLIINLQHRMIAAKEEDREERGSCPCRCTSTDPITKLTISFSHTNLECVVIEKKRNSNEI